MNEIASYYIGRRGRLRVRTISGDDRDATDQEWLSIWSRDPSLTIRLAR